MFKKKEKVHQKVLSPFFPENLLNQIIKKKEILQNEIVVKK